MPALPLSSAIWSGTKRRQKPGELQETGSRNPRVVFEAKESNLLGESAATQPSLAKNTKAPDSGLSHGAFVEQPSPRTAQLQPRFVEDPGKWHRRATSRGTSGHYFILAVGQWVLYAFLPVFCACRP